MLYQYLIVSGILFLIGTFGVLTRRNLIVIFLSIEIMLNAANLSFVAFSSFGSTISGQVVTLFTIAIAASEVAIGLAMVVVLFRNKENIESDSITNLKL